MCRLYEVSVACVGTWKDQSALWDLLQTASVVQFTVDRRATQVGERRGSAEKQRTQLWRWSVCQQGRRAVCMVCDLREHWEKTNLTAWHWWYHTTTFC